MYKIKIEGNILKWEVVILNTKKDYKQEARKLFKQYFPKSKKRIFVWLNDELIFTYNEHDNTTKELT